MIPTQLERGSCFRLLARRLTISGIIIGCAALSYATVRKIRDIRDRMDSWCQLHVISGAMLNIADMNGYSAASICDKNGLPLLSWRVAILPQLERDDLYNQFHLHEPWDSPHNIQLLPKMPKFYKLPGDDKTPPDHTHYLVFVGIGAAFKDPCSRHKREDVVGSFSAILVVEAAKAVPWTKPEDLLYNPKKPIAPLLSTHFHDGCSVAQTDGSVELVPFHTPEATLRAWVTGKAR